MFRLALWIFSWSIMHVDGLPVSGFMNQLHEACEERYRWTRNLDLSSLGPDEEPERPQSGSDTLSKARSRDWRSFSDGNCGGFCD